MNSESFHSYNSQAYKDGDVFKYRMNMEGRPKAGYPLTVSEVWAVFSSSQYFG